MRRFFEHIGAALSEPVIGSPFVGRQALAASVNKITSLQIRSLIAIAESPSIEAAARRLDVSQPSLYRPARDLERELRRSLYHRTAQGVTTNAQGAELARRFQVALREIEYGLEELYAAQGSVVSRIVVGNIPHSGERVLSAAVDAFLASYPTAHVQVVDGHYDVLLNDLRAGKLDLLFGVLRRPAWAIDVREELLFENPYVVVARARSSAEQGEKNHATRSRALRLDHAGGGGAAPAGVRAHVRRPAEPAEGQHRDDVPRDLPQHSGELRPPDADVAARRPIERERRAHGAAVPLAAPAPLGRGGEPDRLASDPGPPAVPAAACAPRRAGWRAEDVLRRKAA